MLEVFLNDTFVLFCYFGPKNYVILELRLPSIDSQTAVHFQFKTFTLYALEDDSSVLLSTYAICSIVFYIVMGRWKLETLSHTVCANCA